MENKCCQNCSPKNTLPEVAAHLDGPHKCWLDNCPCHNPSENTSWRKRFDGRFGDYGFFKEGVLPDEIKHFIDAEFISLISQLEVEKETLERFGDEYSQGKVAGITAAQDLIRNNYLV